LISHPNLVRKIASEWCPFCTLKSRVYSSVWANTDSQCGKFYEKCNNTCVDSLMHRLGLASERTKHKDCRENCTLETVRFHSEKHVKAPFDLRFLEKGFRCSLPDQGMNLFQ